MSQWPEQQPGAANLNPENMLAPGESPEAILDIPALAAVISKRSQELDDYWQELRATIQAQTKQYLELPDEKPETDVRLLTELASDLSKLEDTTHPGTQTILVANMKKAESFFNDRLPDDLS